MGVKIFIITLLCICRVYCQIDMYGPMNSEDSKEKAVRDNSYSQDNEDVMLKENVTHKEDSRSAELVNFLAKTDKDTEEDSESEEKKKHGLSSSKKEKDSEENIEENVDYPVHKDKEKDDHEENTEENSEENDNNALHKENGTDSYEDKSEPVDQIEHRIVQEFNDDEDEDIEEFKRHESDENEENLLREELEKERENQKLAGSVADYFGTNQHYEIPANFYEFGRRFVLSYPYFEKNNTVDPVEVKLDREVKEQLEMKKHYFNHLTPLKAPPEFVLSIAKQSAILEATKPKNPSEDIIKKAILRTGNFWNGVWKEEVDKKTLLRTSSKSSNKLEKVTVEIAPGSKLYELISVLKKKSPVLLYVINKYNAD